MARYATPESTLIAPHDREIEILALFIQNFSLFCQDIWPWPRERPWNGTYSEYDFDNKIHEYSWSLLKHCPQRLLLTSFSYANCLYIASIEHLALLSNTTLCFLLSEIFCWVKLFVMAQSCIFLSRDATIATLIGQALVNLKLIIKSELVVSHYARNASVPFMKIFARYDYFFKILNPSQSA